MMPSERTRLRRATEPASSAPIGLAWWEVTFLLLVLAAAAAIRFASAPGSLWYDEIASLKFAEQPYAALWSNWMRRETNPPLYYTALKAWRSAFGDTDAALRGLSVAIGLAGLVVAWALGRELGGRRAGLWAAALAALAPAHVLYSQQVRGYGLCYSAALLALLGVALMVRDRGSPQWWRGLAIYAAGTVAALHTHTTMALLPLIANAYAIGWFVAQSPKPMRLAWAWLATNVLILLAWSWWLRVTVWQIGHASNVGWLIRPPPVIAARWGLDTYVFEGGGPTRGAAALLLAALAAYAAWRGRRGPTLLLAATAGAVPLLLFLASYASPVLLPRTLFWASGPFTVLVALGVAALRPRLGALAGGAAAAAMAADCIAIGHRPALEPWRAVVDVVGRSDSEAWMVAGDPGVAFALRHYCPPASCRLRILTVEPAAETWSTGMPRPEQRPLRDFASLARSHRLFSATRLGRGDLSIVARPVATAHDWRDRLVLPRTLDLIEWTPTTGGESSRDR